MSVDREFAAILADRCESWEIAEFLGISARDFIDMFEDEVEMNYDDLAEWIGLRGKGDSDYDSDSEYSSV